MLLALILMQRKTGQIYLFVGVYICLKS